MKNKAIALYVVFGFLYAIYAWIFGDTAHKGFAYNLGQGLVWPAVMFPELGAIVGGVLIVLFVALITML